MPKAVLRHSDKHNSSVQQEVARVAAEARGACSGYYDFEYPNAELTHSHHFLQGDKEL